MSKYVLAGLKFFVPRLKKIWADAAYRGQELAECVKPRESGNWKLWNAHQAPAVWAWCPRRMGRERTFGWISREPENEKDYERKAQTSETLIQVAMIRLLLARLARHQRGLLAAST